MYGVCVKNPLGNDLPEKNESDSDSSTSEEEELEDEAKRKSLKTMSRENECFTSNLLTVLYFIISLIKGKMRKKIQKSNSSVTDIKI